MKIALGLLAALSLASVVGCKGGELSPASVKPTARAAANHGTQQDLVRELDSAERVGNFGDVRRRWQGQRLTWTVTRQRALCATADLCNVAAFPIQRPAKHGWMPKLSLDAAALAALDAKCGEAPQCDFTFEGTLSELDVSGEQATKMTFSDITIAHS